MAVNEIRRNGSFAPLSARYYQDSAIAAIDERAEMPPSPRRTRSPLPTTAEMGDTNRALK